MGLRRWACMWIGLVMAAASAAAAQGPDPAIRARVDSFVGALNSASAEGFEAMAREAYTPELLTKRSPAERARLFERIHADFGTLTLEGVDREGDGPLVLTLRGTTGLEGQFELDLEPAPPHRISGLSVRVQQGGDRPPQGPPPPITGSMPPAELSRALDEHVSRLAEADAFAGVVLVAKDGAAIFQKAYGLADRDSRTPSTPATRFNLGSINKIFTKTAIARLMSEGKVALTDTIGALLPDYPNADARGATVEQLLEHRAGIADIFGPAFADAPKSTFRSNADYYRFVASQPLAFAPGTRRQYCNGCYVVLGALIERISGVPYEQYVAEHVFARAGMTGAGAFQSDRLPRDVARGYTRRSPEGETALHSNERLHGAAGSAAGGGYASAADLLAFDNALRQQRLLDAKMTAWVLGVDRVGPGRAEGSMGVAGGAPGVNAVLESSGTWTVVVLGNLDPPAAEQLGAAIHKQLSR